MVRVRIGFSLSSIFLIWASLISQSLRRCRAHPPGHLHPCRSWSPKARCASRSELTVLGLRPLCPSHHVDEFLLGGPQLGAVNVRDRIALLHVHSREIDVELLDPALDLRIDVEERPLVILDEPDGPDDFRERLDRYGRRLHADELLFLRRRSRLWVRLQSSSPLQQRAPWPPAFRPACLACRALLRCAD